MTEDLTGVMVVISIMLLHLALGVPLFVVLGLGALVIILMYDVYSLAAFGDTPFSSIDSWALLAMPLFILAGEIISRGRTARHLVNLAEAIVGWMKGGLGMATIFGCFLFAGTSGSSSADTITIGKIMVPPMREQGYLGSYAASLAASGGILGVIVPPSLIFIIYGVSTSTSIGGLFLGGILPGLVMAVTMCCANYFVCRYSSWGSVEHSQFQLKRLGRAFWDAKYGIGAPVIILGGIYTGVFTPTEAAAVAIGYVTVVEFIIHKSITIRDIGQSLSSAAIATGMLAPIIAFSILFGETLAILHVPRALIDNFMAIDVGLVGSVVIIVLVLLIVGFILEPIAAVLVVMPILAPIGTELGFDPVHFGVFAVCALGVGFITPPVGINLFAASAVTGEQFIEIAWRAVPSFLGLMVAIGVIATFSDLVLWYQ